MDKDKIAIRHGGTEVIETRRLILRRAVIDDVTPYLKNGQAILR